jgi:hypothetical protein
VSDVQEVLLKGTQELPDELYQKYGELFSELLKTRLGPRVAREGTLRMSNVGTPCERKLWYSVNTPNDGEPLPPEAIFKFLYGDAIELLMLFLAEAAGHKVEGTQDEQEIEGVKGHRDAVIDGTIVDVKSASTYSFKKFQDGSLAEQDSFGYIDQLQSYLYAGQTDDKVTDRDRGAFFVADKTLGHICLDIHDRKKVPYDKIIRHKKEVVSSKKLPARGFDPIPEGKSGNMKLPMQCGYCDYKHKCHPNIRTFLYSYGPTYLTTVEREPNVTELPNRK